MPGNYFLDSEVSHGDAGSVSVAQTAKCNVCMS